MFNAITLLSIITCEIFDMFTSHTHTEHENFNGFTTNIHEFYGNFNKMVIVRVLTVLKRLH